jgi:hypothetical protein
VQVFTEGVGGPNQGGGVYRISALSAAIALANGVAPAASADPNDFQYVRTQSGVVRCVITDEVTLVYGETYHIKGWTVLPAFDGTRFTNDASGHGVFVSIGRVSPF